MVFTTQGEKPESLIRFRNKAFFFGGSNESDSCELCTEVLHPDPPAIVTPQSLVNFYWRQRRLLCASAPRRPPVKSDVDYISGLFAPLRPFLVERSCGDHGRRSIWHEVVEMAPQTWRKGFGEVKDAGWLSPIRCDRLVCTVITRY